MTTAVKTIGQSLSITSNACYIKVLQKLFSELLDGLPPEFTKAHLVVQGVDNRAATSDDETIFSFETATLNYKDADLVEVRGVLEYLREEEALYILDNGFKFNHRDDGVDETWCVAFTGINSIVGRPDLAVDAFHDFISAVGETRRLKKAS
ncbi:MAG: hypothetical protein LBM12_01195 [Candidatus Nomurabacteria bacterium]|jgi:hypothetical protein|nr:hypothetical protein [Candidatus Nomurabacteria bacterium]